MIHFVSVDSTGECCIADRSRPSVRSTARRARQAPRVRGPFIFTRRPWPTSRPSSRWPTGRPNCKRPGARRRAARTCRLFRGRRDRHCAGRGRFRVRIRFWPRGSRAITATNSKSRTATNSNRLLLCPSSRWWRAMRENRRGCPFGAAKTSSWSRRIRLTFTGRMSLNVNRRHPKRARPSLAHPPCPKTPNWWPAGSARRSSASPSLVPCCSSDVTALNPITKWHNSSISQKQMRTNSPASLPCRRSKTYRASIWRKFRVYHS